MKVALQLSGQQRYGEHIPLFLQSLNIFDEIDIFAHHWSEPRSIDEIVTFLECVKTSKINIKHIVTEPQIQFDIKSEWRTHGHSIFNIMSQAYSIYSANNLRKMSNVNYDLIIRARPDLRLHDFPIDQNWFDKIEENTIVVGQRPSNLTAQRLAIQDQIAICRPNTMDRYSEIYNNFDLYFAEGNILGPELLFYWWLVTKNNFNIDETTFSTYIDLRGLPNIDFRYAREKY